MNRRHFIGASAAALLATNRARGLALGTSASPLIDIAVIDIAVIDIAVIDRQRILANGRKYLAEKPVTITASSSPRSPGGPHDYFSEGDYWWPNPKDPAGPYIQRDGFTNPDNFDDHRKAMIRLSLIVPALAAAWKLTGEPRFSQAAAQHLRAWFVTPETRMNPNLEHAQAITNLNKGRGIGIIDTLHLVEVAQAVVVLEKAPGLTAGDRAKVLAWFSDYLDWMFTSANGISERDAKNNHGTCWLLQAAAFARLTGNQAVMRDARERFRTIIVPNQIATDGSLPLELRRTKPYSYSLFDLEALTGVCEVLSTPGDDLWTFETADGRSIRKAVAYMYPFILDKSKWPLKPDVEHFDEFPVRQISLFFAGLAYRDAAYLALWKTLDPDPTSKEVIRNWPIRQPILWI